MNNKKAYQLYLDFINNQKLSELYYNDLEVKTLVDDLIFFAAQSNLTPCDKTTISCHRCHVTNAPAYSLKKVAGKYIALCIDDTGGCSSREATLDCEYTDSMSSQCTEVAEWKIFFGEDGTLRANACSAHIGLMLNDHHVHKIYPIE